jgi:F-type H+-transporting ATPase subunit epsilon
MDKIHAKIITPTGVLYSDDVDMVVMPGSEGEFGVMAGHVPMIVQLKAGQVRLYSDETHTPFIIKDGIAHITPSGVNILFQ